MTRLLIIESNHRDQERFRAFLAGYDLIVVNNGIDALSAANRPDQPVQAAIVRWDLDGAPGGPELVSELRRKYPDLPVIVTSGLMDLSVVARAKSLGACDILSIPLDRARLLGAVGKALTSGTCNKHLDALRRECIGESPAFVASLVSISQALRQPGEPVLLVGETGTGKEVAAKAIHKLSAKDKRRWTAVNMAGIPAQLLESTLFGHEAGAFTDARERRIGAFEEAGTGTLFLDEIGELETRLQAKLLRVLQERTFRRVGGTDELDFRATLVLATNRNLVREMDAGRFREDLYHRIATHEIRLPPLRDRGDDRWLLLDHFLEIHAKDRSYKMAAETIGSLSAYSFPGNVRELENIVKSALGACDDGLILPLHLPVERMQEREAAVSDSPSCVSLPLHEKWHQMPHKMALKELEKALSRIYLTRKFEEADHVVVAAAKASGMDPKTFRNKWKEAGLSPLTGRDG